MLSHEELLSLVSYFPDTGVFIRLKCRHRRFEGIPIRSMNKQGYISVVIKGERFSGHRLAWFYVYGKWPEGEIDHVNGNKADNRIANLRDVTDRINKGNYPVHRNGKLPGVHLTRNKSKWHAYIKIKGKSISLGYYKSKEEAYSIYLDAVKNEENMEWFLQFKTSRGKGYYWDTKRRKFMVRYKDKFIGRYDTEEEAQLAFIKAKENFV